jgi:tetratricopeptide (TPR) repeat protein
MRDRQIDIFTRELNLKFARLVAPLIIIGLTACTSSPPKPSTRVVEPVSADKSSELASEQRRLRDSVIENGKHWGDGFAGLLAVLADPSFNSLSVDDQFEALTLLARLSMYSKQREVASGYISRAVGLPGLGFEDQVAAMGIAREMGNWAVAVRCLTSIPHRWPERLGSVDRTNTAQIVNRAYGLPRNDRFLLLQALYGAHWTLRWGIEPSQSRSDLTLFLLQQGSLREAIDVSSHIKATYTLIAMRADRRFDAVVARHPDQFVIEAAADREAKLYQSLADEHPRSLELQSRVMEVLMHEQHYAAMLAASDSAAQAIRSTNFPDRLYDDYAGERASFFHFRSLALQRVGRWDQAVAMLIEASREGDIEQLVHLGYLYCALGRPKEALTVIGPVGRTRTGPYGAMQVEAVRLEAAVQLEDHDLQTRSLQYLSEHRADSPDAYINSLVAAKQFDQAAQYLIAQLKDEDRRGAPSLDAQHYLATPGPENQLYLEKQWRSVIARKEVQAAIVKVGRVESYHLEPP